MTTCIRKQWLLALFAGCFVAIAPPDEPENPLADLTLGNEAGQIRDDNGLKMKLIWCAPGFFWMEQIARVEKPDGFILRDGREKTSEFEEITLVRTHLSSGFWLGQYEVTQREWLQLMKSEPWKGRPDINQGADFPATWISWEGAMAFCSKLTTQERIAGRLPVGWEFTLPSEAQWERACRARTETRFSFGEDEPKLEEYAWFAKNASTAGEDYAHRVGQKKPNPWGFYDMHGNIWEWCRDRYDVELPGGRNPEVVDSKREDYVIRGGCWYERPSRCRSGSRLGEARSAEKSATGFRVALTPVRPAK